MCALKNRFIAKFCLLGLLFIAVNGFAQSKKDLEKKKYQLKKEINLINEILKETRKNKENSLDELIKLNSKIEARNGLIGTIKAEIRLINRQINKSEKVISSLEKDIAQLKEEYAKMIYYAFKHKNSYDKIMFVFAAKSFNQAYKRIKYIQQYAAYRKTQTQLIVKAQKKLKKNIAQLKSNKQEKAVVISLEEQEKQKLDLERVEQKDAVKKLQNKEQELKNKLRKKEQAAKKLQKAIQRIIAEEIRKAKEAAEKEGKTAKGFPMTPEAKKLSNLFANNKGKLPWPVTEGVITSKFGKHPHPVLKNIIVNNNGIDISTKKRVAAQAIFNGTVSSVAIIPGEGKVVMIRHGEYLSVYSYLSEVYVKKGDQITTHQPLGILVNQPGKSATYVHLEIWKGMTKLNPQYWILRQ